MKSENFFTLGLVIIGVLAMFSIAFSWVVVFRENDYGAPHRSNKHPNPKENPPKRVLEF